MEDKKGTTPHPPLTRSPFPRGGRLEASVLLSALKRLKVETGSLACLGCGLEHDCGTKGCRIIREAVELIEGQGQAMERALGQLRTQEDACESCVHGGTALPCANDEDPVMLCDTCTYECHCKECSDYSRWEWNGGGDGVQGAG